MSRYHNTTHKGLPPPAASSYEEYDQLPLRVRRALCESAFDYATSAVVSTLSSTSEEYVLSWLNSGNNLNVQSSASVNYGQDHPQAQEDYHYEPLRRRAKKRIR